MKTSLRPKNFPCPLAYCPPGLFLSGTCLGFKSEYGNRDVYVVESGEAFWGGTSTDSERDRLVVIPCEFVILADDDPAELFLDKPTCLCPKDGPPRPGCPIHHPNGVTR